MILKWISHVKSVATSPYKIYILRLNLWYVCSSFIIWSWHRKCLFLWVNASPDRAGEPAASCPECNRQPAGSRNQGSGSGWLSDPALWPRRTAHQTTGTWWEIKCRSRSRSQKSLEESRCKGKHWTKTLRKRSWSQNSDFFFKLLVLFDSKTPRQSIRKTHWISIFECFLVFLLNFFYVQVLLNASIWLLLN